MKDDLRLNCPEPLTLNFPYSSISTYKKTNFLISFDIEKSNDKMNYQRRHDDYGMGLGSSDLGLGSNSGLGSDSGLGSGCGSGSGSEYGLGMGGSGSRLSSKIGTGGLDWSGGLEWSGGLRGSRCAKWAKMAGLASEGGSLSGSGCGSMGGSRNLATAPAASVPVDPPVLLNNLGQLDAARARVFKGLDATGDGVLLALVENKWFKRLQQLCDRLGAQGAAVCGLLSHTTALPSPGLNMALQDWMAAVTGNLRTLHEEMESVAVQRLILMASDISDATDMADAVEGGDEDDIADTATGIAVNDATTDACEELFGRIDGPLARCYKTLVQRAAEMDNNMMPASHHELSGGGWNVPSGPGRW